jgi:hypothetical protein
MGDSRDERTEVAKIGTSSMRHPSSVSGDTTYAQIGIELGGKNLER